MAQGSLRRSQTTWAFKLNVIHSQERDEVRVGDIDIKHRAKKDIYHLWKVVRDEINSTTNEAFLVQVVRLLRVPTPQAPPEKLSSPFT